MRSAWAAAAILAAMASEAAAAGWRTVVQDSLDGSRITALRGETSGDAESGLVVMCAEGAAAGVVFASPPTRDFSVKPGDSSLLAVGTTAISLAQILRNDSSATVALGEVVDLPGLLDILTAAEDPMKVDLANVAGPGLEIPRGGLDEAVSEFRIACR